MRRKQRRGENKEGKKEEGEMRRKDKTRGEDEVSF